MIDPNLYITFVLISLANLADKYLTALTILELNFDHPNISIPKIIDKHELNPLGRWIMHKLGLVYGMAIGFIITELLMFLILFYNEPTFATFTIAGSFLGGLYLVDFVHFHNLNQIEKKRKAELTRLRERFKNKRR